MKAGTRPGRGRTTFRFLKPCLLFATVVPVASLHAQALPDAPSAILGYALQTLSPPPAQQPTAQQSAPLPPLIAAPTPATEEASQQPCSKTDQLELRKIPWLLRSPDTIGPCRVENPLQPFVSSNNAQPLTPQLKAFLAVRNVADPFNLITIVGYSGIYVAANSHSAYGPGFGAWGKLAGYSLLEDMQSEFFGTFAIPTLLHEDPRYHRLPGRPIPKRILHALAHTVVSQHDDGRPMLNYATLLTYPISAELSNLYVPGIGVNAPSTAKRVLAGYATDPVGAIVAEFLPDLAKHIHIRVVFVQEILQRVATQNNPNAI